jgi:hypothetical protein
MLNLTIPSRIFVMPEYQSLKAELPYRALFLSLSKKSYSLQVIDKNERTCKTFRQFLDIKVISEFFKPHTAELRD